jgi:hypothetical protein
VNQPKRFFVLIFALGLFCGVAAYFHLSSRPVDGHVAIQLLIPDTVNDNTKTVIGLWKDAADDQGLPIESINYSKWIRQETGIPRKKTVKPSALIVPDGLFRTPPEAMADALRNFVKDGGKLMLVHDASMIDSNGPAHQTSRIADLAGVNYTADKDNWSELEAPGSFFRGIGIPPGRTVAKGNLEVVSGYAYKLHTFPGLPSAAESDGKVLLRFTDGRPAALVRDFGKGQVLFVNLPLSHLKLQTDAAWLHGFLSYFGKNILKTPTLSSVPDGIGGMTLNFHCDAKICEIPMRELNDKSVFEHGPFSIHVTTGPGQRSEDDGRGLNLDNNVPFKTFLKTLQSKGHVIGSHGGWIHDKFSVQVNKDNENEFLPYLEQNKRSIESIIGKAQTEYSSPSANNPEWVIRWLEKTGVQAYYTTANIGMPPIVSWRNQKRDQGIWSFPVQSFGELATIEDAVRAGIKEPVFAQWLSDLVDYSVNSRTTRLVYFHPPGAMMMPQAIDTLIKRADSYERQGVFKWRTMESLAQFLTQRSKLHWQLRWLDNQQLQLKANHPTSLAKMTWLFDKTIFKKPTITEGKATIAEDADVYRVIAMDTPTLQLLAQPLSTNTIQ